MTVNSLGIPASLVVLASLESEEGSDSPAKAGGARIARANRLAKTHVIDRMGLLLP
jgi:hypothetical protein